MYPNSSVRNDMAQARIADLHYQARRESFARAVRSAQPNRPRVPGRLRFRSVLRHRAAAAAS